jgi:diguanylate cyclase (GGDEF)-like protein/PAS domain S-box-containing protein
MGTVEPDREPHHATALSSVDFRELVQHSPAPCFASDGDGRCVYVNSAWSELTGLGLDDSLGLGWMSVLSQDDIEDLDRTRADEVARGKPFELRFRIVTPEEETRWLRVDCYPLDSCDVPGGWVGWIEDETAEIALRDAMAERDALIQAVFDNSAAGLVVVDRRGGVVRANARFCEWMAASEEELVGTIGFAVITPEEREASRTRMESLLAGEKVPPVLRTLISRDDREIPVWSTIAPIPTLDGEPQLYIATSTEFAERFQHELHLNHLAHHDPLTGLPNRRALDQWATTSAAEAAVLIDLDGFKAINDAHGHHLGDQVLVQVAERLRHCVRHGDLLCRFGGDEFLVVLAEAPAGTAEALLERLNEAFRAPFTAGDKELDLRASMGVATGASDIATLAIEADADLYSTKAENRRSR